MRAASIGLGLRWRDLAKTLLASDEVVVEATANSMAVSRVLAPFVARVIIANPLQVKANAQAHVKTDKIDAGTLASLQAAGYLPQICTPDAGDRTQASAGGAALPGRTVSHAAQERGAFDPTRPPDPEVPARRSFQRQRRGLVGRPTTAGR
ncbi:MULTISPECIES: hypothetical protein [unclassified Bradyrhizobium]|uniref:hypothetical protein n=1 Tax=unclassified Bradyrhizobium TaxID=2631580 RepID=UPI001CD27AAE|nr:MULTISPECIES: hypothetical protein [unclassified Bradyrhizobium]